MKIDLGFWNQQGEYIQDIQEVNEMDMDKYFEELNDMANFKGFGEKEADEKSLIEKLQEKLEWLIKALDYPENQNELQQAKLYAQIDLIRWLGIKRGE